jgi:transcriptional regulator with AAA-type ATPase domain
MSASQNTPYKPLPALTPSQKLRAEFEAGKLNTTPLSTEIESKFSKLTLDRVKKLLPADQSKFNSLANLGVIEAAEKFLDQCELHYIKGNNNSMIGIGGGGGAYVYKIEPTFKPQIQSGTDAILDTYITQDEDTIKMKERVRHLTSLDEPVLITGPTGTGKEIIARALACSKMTQLVSINCAGLPENLVESELFGHVRGSFTGAIQDKVGLFKAATNGTIFLDEFGELSMSMQAKLLRVIQEKSIRRVGSNDSEPINCRIIVATNKDLPAECAKGLFREDLYWRVAVFTLKTKRLWDRIADVPLIIDSIDTSRSTRPFAGKFPRDHKFTEAQLSGNVRALQAYIKRYAMFGELDFN